MIGPEKAETLALQALGWLAGQDELLARFLYEGGLDADDLRARAGTPEMLASVLDFLLADEALVLAFAREAGVPPDLPMQARMALPGGAHPHWT